MRPHRWTEEFLNYDYIGAPWEPGLHFTKSGKEVLVGNGGFSLRSQKIMTAPRVLNLPFTDNGTGYFHEDGQLCNYHRERLEEHGIKFAPVDLAAKFSKEICGDKSGVKPFGYHNARIAKPFMFEIRNKIQRTINS